MLEQYIVHHLIPSKDHIFTSHRASKRSKTLKMNDSFSFVTPSSSPPNRLNGIDHRPNDKVLLALAWHIV